MSINLLLITFLFIFEIILGHGSGYKPILDNSIHDPTCSNKNKQQNQLVIVSKLRFLFSHSILLYSLHILISFIDFLYFLCSQTKSDIYCSNLVMEELNLYRRKTLGFGLYSLRGNLCSTDGLNCMFLVSINLIFLKKLFFGFHKISLQRKALNSGNILQVGCHNNHHKMHY